VFASYLPALVVAGAAFLGGCCGTTPEFIRALAARKIG
jgi:methionine synthase I (cobalamin-dependent)